MAAHRREPVTPQVRLARRVAEKRDRNDLHQGRTDLVCARYWETVSNVARSMLHYSEAAAQDAISITWARLVTEWDRGKQYRAPIAVVIYTVARWESRGVANKTYRHNQRMRSLDIVHNLTASDAFRELEAIDWMESLFAYLPPRDREVMELRYLDEMPPAHVAEYLGIAPNAEYQAANRALTAIRLIESA